MYLNNQYDINMEFETTLHSASTFLKSVLTQVYFAHLRTTSFGWLAGTFEFDPSTNTRQWHWLMLFFTVCQPLLMRYFTRDLSHHIRFLTSTFYTSYLIDCFLSDSLKNITITCCCGSVCWYQKQFSECIFNANKRYHQL